MSANVFSLRGRRALITGGSRGIGLGIARGMAAAGADLILVARTAVALRQAQAELATYGVGVEIAPFDLQCAADIGEFYSEVVSGHGSVDILVNDAGTSRRGPAHELSLDDWQAVIDLNLTAVFALSQAFARDRINRGGGGKIIQIGSLMCTATRPGTAPYTAAKGGLLQLTKALAVDWAPHGILVNAIGPGYIQTDLTQPLVDDAEFSGWVERRCPLQRWGSPEDIAGAAVFLASSAADFITGQILYVDGGWLATF